MRKIFAILLMGLCLGGCRKTLPEGGETGLPADLSLTLRLPRIETKSPGYADGQVSPSDAAGSLWSDWDRLVDGQSIYRLTLFLVRRADQQLVGFRDFYKNSPNYYGGSDSYGPNGFCASDGTMLPSSTEFATAAKAYFSYLNPMHGAHEKLGSGNYRLYAVANYSPISGVSAEGGTTRSYGGVPDDGNGTALTSLIDNIKTSYEASTDGLAGFDASGYPAFFNYKVKAAQVGGVEQYVVEQCPQPLTFIADFLVLSGTNQIEAELVRTYSRIRFVVHNDNVSPPAPDDPAPTLSVKGLSFVTPFAQKQALLFDFGTDEKYNSEWLGAPVLDSPHAIHPYDGSTIQIAPQQSSVIFDAYVLESKRGSDRYQYKIDVEYAGVSGNQIKLKQANPIRRLNDLKTAYNAGNYKFLIKAAGDSRGFLFDNTLNTAASSDKQRVMIENYTESVSGGKKYLDANAMANTVTSGSRNTTVIVASNGNLSRVDGGPITELELQSDALRPFVWTFEKIGDWNFDIMNDFTGQYWDKNIVSSNNNIRLRTVAVDYFHYAPENFSKDGTNGLGFRSAYPTGSTVYLNRDGYGHSSKNILDNMWILYPLVSEAAAGAEKTVTLQILDQQTHQPYDLEELRRNDFVTVNISVSIHPDGGYLEFKVIPWNKKEGEITFE